MARRKATVAEERSAVEVGSIPPPPRPRAFGGVPTGWQHASEVLDSVTAVPTRFVSFNRASRVGGLPVRRIHTIHGPTANGKSMFVGGLLESFISSGNIGAYVDAEHSTPNEWFEKLFGMPLREVQNFVAERPRNYQSTITKVDAFLAWVKGIREAERKAGRRAPHSIVGVDSISKLVPKQEIAALMGSDSDDAAPKKGGKGPSKKGGDAIDKGWGRLRAAMNQAWLDHLTPLLGDADCAMCLIAQERAEDDDLSWDPSQHVTIKGGGSLTFDASMIMRISKGSPVRLDDADGSPIVGFKHRIRIWKSKVGSLDGRWTDAYFHVSNGKLTPEGFDTARDLVEVAKEMELVSASGSWISWGRKRWQGTKRAVLAISGDRKLEADLLAAVNEAIEKERASR